MPGVVVGRRGAMANNDTRATAQHKPTGQELDRQYDDLHEEHDADALPTPEERRREREQELADYAEDLKDPD
jgi:hypothetical protein